jgi:hypothetical protein
MTGQCATRAVAPAISLFAALSAGGCVLTTMRYDVTLTPPSAPVSRIEPVTTKRVTVARLVDARQDRRTFRSGVAFWRIVPKNEDALLEEATAVLIATLVSAGVPATPAINVNDVGGIHVTPSLTELRIDPTVVSKGNYRGDSVTIIDVQVTGEDSRNVRFSVTGKGSAEWQGKALPGPLINQAMQDAMEKLAAHPGAAEAFRP